MSNGQFVVNKKTVGFSFITQFFQYCANILVLPFILSSIDADTMGIWYLFLSVSGIATLLDFGFSQALSRNVSYVFSGVQELKIEGTIKSEGSINYKLLDNLLYTSRLTYKRIALIMLVVLLIFGTIYIYIATSHNIDVLPVWIFFAVSICINYYYNYVNVFVRGKGDIILSNYLIITTRVSYIVIIFILLYFNLGLWALTIANVASAFIGRWIGLYYFWDENLKKNIAETENYRKENLFGIIWHNAKKFGIASFTTFAFTQANVLIAGMYLNLQEVASLGLCLQLCQIIVTVAKVYYQTYYPKICALWVSDNVKQIRMIFLKSQVIGYFFWISGFLALTFLGPWVLRLIKSNTELPQTGVILIYAFFYLMELTHGNCSVLISSKNSVPFLKASVFACITSLILMFLFLSIGLGIYSFPLAMCCANIPYNSWKWVHEAYKLLK